MPGKHTCYILTMEKAADFKDARLRTSVTTIVKTMAARWCLGTRTGYVITDATTSFRIKSLTCSLWGVILKTNLMVLNVQIRVLIAKWAPTIIANG